MADRRDLPQVRAHVQLAVRVHGRLPGVPLRLLAGAAVHVDQGAQPRPLPADRGAGRARPVRPRRRQLDRARLQHPLRRVAGAPVPARPGVLRAGVRAPLPRVLEPGRLRLQRPAAADHARRRHRPLPDAEAVLERLQQARVPHVPLAGDRRQRGAHALPARRHLQRAGGRRRDPPQRERLQGSRPLALELPALRLRRRRRRPDASDARDPAPRRRPAGRAAHGPAHERRVLRRARARRAATCPCSSASCTSSTTAAPTPRRRRSSAGTGSASSCCTTSSCWRRSRTGAGSRSIRAPSSRGSGRRSA